MKVNELMSLLFKEFPGARVISLRSDQEQFMTILFIPAQAARNALRGEDSLAQLRKDWNALDLHTIFAHTLYAIQPLDIPQEFIAMVPSCE